MNSAHRRAYWRYHKRHFLINMVGPRERKMPKIQCQWQALGRNLSGGKRESTDCNLERQ